MSAESHPGITGHQPEFTSSFPGADVTAHPAEEQHVPGAHDQIGLSPDEAALFAGLEENFYNEDLTAEQQANLAAHDEASVAAGRVVAEGKVVIDDQGVKRLDDTTVQAAKQTMQTTYDNSMAAYAAQEYQRVQDATKNTVASIEKSEEEEEEPEGGKVVHLRHSAKSTPKTSSTDGRLAA